MPQSLRTGEGWGAAADRAETWRYHPEDGAVVDDEGSLTLLGRIDDAINVAGRRFSTMELESVIAGVDGVVEAAVVGADHATTGTAIYAYVSPTGNTAEADLRARIKRAVETAIGSVATPEAVVFTAELPKTRSGKVMRRLLTAIANGEEPGDLSALRNPEILGELQSATQTDSRFGNL